jgi:hypothetical protein
MKQFGDGVQMLSVVVADDPSVIVADAIIAGNPGIIAGVIVGNPVVADDPGAVADDPGTQDWLSNSSTADMPVDTDNWVMKDQQSLPASHLR